MCCGQTEAVCVSVSDSGTPASAWAFLSPALASVCVCADCHLAGVCFYSVCVCSNVRSVDLLYHAGSHYLCLSVCL